MSERIEIYFEISILRLRLHLQKAMNVVVLISSTSSSPA